MRTIAFIALMLGCAASGWGMTNGADFWADGIHYCQITPISGNEREVMVCSPQMEGKEYQFPLTENGEAVIAETVEYNTFSFAITRLDDDVFCDNAEVKTVVLPASVKAIGKKNFNNCSNLETLVLTAVENCGANSVCNLPKLNVLTLPTEASLTLPSNSFMGLGITNLTIPSGIRFSSPYAFSNCENLYEVDMSEAVLSESDQTNNLEFYNCDALKVIHFPSNQSYSIDRSFTGTYDLEKLYLPEQIGDDVIFYACCAGVTSVAEVYSPSVIPPAFENVYERPEEGEDPYEFYFGGYSLENQPVIYVPEGSSQAYKESKSWSRFTNIVEYDFANLQPCIVDVEQAPIFSVVGRSIVANSGKPLMVFTMAGERVAPTAMAPGIYLAVSDGHCEKVVIR
jgi:hypothetical protein